MQNDALVILRSRGVLIYNSMSDMDLFIICPDKIQRGVPPYREILLPLIKYQLSLRHRDTPPTTNPLPEALNEVGDIACICLC